MARIETWLNQDLMQPVKVRYLDGNLFSQDNAGNLIGVNLTRDGEAYSGGGSVSANVIRADGGTVAVTGALSGNVATVVLPQAAYLIPGVVSIVVKLTVSGEVTTIAAVVANVYQSSTDTVIDPGTIIPSIQTLVSSIETAVASIPADYSSLWTSLAPAFNSSTAYTAGQYVTYSGALYQFTADHAAGAWDASHVTATNIGANLNELKSEVNYTDKETGIAVIAGNYKNNDVLFTSDDYPAGTKMYYKFTAQSGKAGYIDILNTSGTRIEYFGKGSSSSGNLTYEGIYVLPAGFGSAKIGATVGAIVTIEYFRTDISNILISKNVADVKKTIGVLVENKTIANGETVLTSSDINAGERIYYSFDTSAATTGYMNFVDDSNNVLLTIGKSSGSYNVSHYEDSLVVPSGFSKIIAATGAGTTLAVNYIFKEESNKALFIAKNILEDEIICRNVGILQESDIVMDTLTGGNNTSMFKYTRASGNYCSSIPIDIRGIKTKVFTVFGVYAVTLYDENGDFVVAELVGEAESEHIIDLSMYNFAYIRFTVKVVLMRKMYVVPGRHSNYAGSTGVFFAENVDMQLMIHKRNAFAPGDFNTSLHREPLCTFTPSGVLLVGADARTQGAVDNSGNNIELCRSLDGGKTFVDHQIVLPIEDKGKTYQSMGGGQFIIDKFTGRIFVFATRENSNIDRITANPLPPKSEYDSDITFKYSDDDGKTWSASSSFDLRESDMTLMVPTPGNGACMNDGTLIMPAWYLKTDGSMHSCIIYSSDHGENWTWKGVGVPANTSECVLTILPNNTTILLDCRNEAGSGYRTTYTTTDLGATYTETLASDYAIKQPNCNASVIRMDLQNDIVYFFASPTDANRSQVKLFVTRDFNTYKELATIERLGGNGYTSLAVFGDLLAICIEESTTQGGIQCAVVKLSQLELGTQKIKIPIYDAGNPVKGEISYNKTTGKLVFIDDTGTARNISFES